MTHSRDHYRAPRWLTAALIGVLWSAAAADDFYQTSFEEGRERPTGWTQPDRGVWESSGAHTGKRCISVTDDNTAGHLWKCKAPWLEPHRLYRFTFWYRTESPDKGPRVRVGLNFANHDYTGKPEWQEQSFVFRAPKSVEKAEIWFGQWRLNGKAYFDDLKIEPVGVSYQHKDGITLGGCERIEKGKYLFDWKIEAENSAYVRVSQDMKTESRGGCIRFWERDNGYFIHRYLVPGHRQLSGTLFIDKINIAKKQCIIAVGKDGKSWREIARLAEGSKHKLALPKDLFPASAIYVKASFPAEIQLSNYRYEAELEGALPDLKGETRFFRGHLLALDNGAIRLKFEEGTRHLLSLGMAGRPIGSVGAQLAQFSRKGEGYKGTGIGWTGAAVVKRFDVKERTDAKCVVDVTGEWGDVPPGLQPCEATYRFIVYAGRHWIESRLLSIKNLGKSECTVRGYYHLLQPSQETAKPKCYGSYAVWLQKGASVAALAEQERDFTLGLRKAGDDLHGDLTRPLQAGIAPGAVWESTQPRLIVCIVPSAEAKEVYRQVERMRSAAMSPAPSGKIVYEEEMAETAPPQKEQK